ncbi:MAG: heavy-metal-associated domain-containing protein [Dysgonamonadaceae bacterium]|jgi:copper chaperone CopZ|nr:heavy-metal-associated domain-containing protein [Dysgonamonadaceae bacterium]
MKNVVILIMALITGLGLSAQEKQDKSKKKKSETVTFAVNIHCDNCKVKIEKNISWEKGVKNLRVDPEKKTVTIVYNPQKTTEENLKKAIEKLGYTCENSNRDAV